MIFPVSINRVATGYLLNIARTSSIGLFKSIGTASSSVSRGFDKYFAGSVSSISRKIPSLVIFAFIFLSALQLTPSPIGHDAPCLGRRITLMSWQKYFPPNWAPIPRPRDISRSSASSSRSLNACPNSFPLEGRLSRYPAEASFTVFKVSSTEVPPIT